MRTRYLVCYDIADPKRLRKVARVCQGYGSRWQLSVFECALDGLTLQKLRTHLSDVLKPAEDQIIFVPLGPEHSPKPDRIEVLGRPLEQRPRVTIV
jgi:CRISPR-associated protein Cas2